MDTNQIKWHNHFNWPRIFIVGGMIIGMCLLSVGVYNATGIHGAAEAVKAAQSGADPLTAAAAAGPEDTNLNWAITIATTVIGVLTYLVSLLKAWQATSGGSVLTKLLNMQQPQALAAMEPAPGETVETLLSKLRHALKLEQAEALEKMAAVARGTTPLSGI